MASRKPLGLSIWLVVKGGGFEPCSAIDISLNGMFLQGNGRDVQVGEAVDLEFQLVFDQMKKWCNLTTKVVRVTKDGIGVLFCHHDSSLFRYVQKMLYEVAGQHAAEESDQTSKEKETEDTSTHVFRSSYN